MADFVGVRGTTITIKVTNYKRTPFGSKALDSPANGINVAIYEEDGTEHTASTAMTESSTGKYYYYWETATTDDPVNYVVDVDIDDGTPDGRHKKMLIALRE